MPFFKKPPRGPGSNIIPFPGGKSRPIVKGGLSSVGEVVDLGQKKKEIEKKEQREQLLDWLAPPEVPTKEEGLSGLGEPPKKFKGLHEAIKDLSESMKKFNEQHDFLLQREGLSELGEDLSLKGLARKVDTISKYSESELKKAKKDIQDGLKGLKILEKADKDNPHIAEEQRQRNIKQKTIWEYMLKDINKRLSILAKEKRRVSILGEERRRERYPPIEKKIMSKEKGETEELDSIFGSMTEQIKPKGVSKQKWITEIENYGLDLEEIKSIVMYNIAKRWDKDTEPRALSKKEWIEELKDWEGMEDDPHEFLGPWFREWLESLQRDE